MELTDRARRPSSRSRSPATSDRKQRRASFSARDLPEPGELQRANSFNVFQKRREDEVVEERGSIDVVLVPAIGAKVKHTFQRNTKSAFDTVYDDVPGATVYKYEHTNTNVQKDHLESYATSLLSWVVSVRRSEFREGPLHFAAHSTGGLVVKKALLIAARREFYRSVWTACCGVTFFGVPHEGSSILSDPMYSGDIKDTIRLGLEPGVWESFSPLLKPGNQELAELNQDFATRARRLSKIWTILETSETYIITAQRNIKFKGRALNEAREIIVDRRSATLDIGNEIVIELNANHKNLCTFLGRANHSQLQQYQRQLAQMIVQEHSRNKEDSLDQQIHQQLQVDVHLFFEDAGIKTESSAVKVLSVKPSLKEFLQVGPRRCLETRFEQEKQSVLAHPIEVDDEEVLQVTRSRPQPSIPEIVISNVDEPMAYGDEKQSSQLYPDFFAPPELAVRPDGTVAKHTSRPDQDIPEIRVHEYQSAEGDSSEPTVPSIAPSQDIKPAKIRQHPSRLWSASERKEEHFRWVHLGANHPGWALEVFDAVALDQEAPNPHERIINEHVWHTRHNLAHYGRPHSRRMRPTAKWITHEQNKSRSRDSKQTNTSMVLYLPYLHWDTVAGVRRRSKRIQSRKDWKSGSPLPNELAYTGSLEDKLLWQYSQSPGNLQLHQRRSLDQFGYPSLVSTAARDHDQVLYKGNRLRKRLQNIGEQEVLNVVPGMLDDELSHEEAELGLTQKSTTSTTTTTKDHGSRENGHSKTSSFSYAAELLKAPTMTFDAQYIDGKLLMVDQLWLYITDKDTVVTFFTPKEELDPENTQQVGDLRASIYNDVNGDHRFATQCHSTVEFAALAVLHAVRLILGHVTDEELQVFQIFEDYISYLKEAQTDSFKRFRQTQKERALAQLKNNKQSKRSKEEEDEDTRDNIDDLRNLTELRDVDDELLIIRRLLDQQYEVVEALRLHANPDTLSVSRSSKARDMLRESLEHISNYRREVDRLKAQCESAHDAYKFLLDMRDKQTNVYEVRQARHSAEVAEDQNRAIIFFTVFTIIFLPLSFFTSFFGMNVSQWSGVDSQPSLHTTLTFLFAISIAVIVVALLLAFNRPIRKITAQLLFTPLRGFRKDLKGRWSTHGSIRGSRKSRDYDVEAAFAEVMGPGSGMFLGMPLGMDATQKQAKRTKRGSFWERAKSNVD